MSGEGLLIDGLRWPGAAATRVAVGLGEWVVAEHRDPEALAAVIAGTRTATGGLVLGARELAGASAVKRIAAGLLTVVGRPEGATPGLRVLDLVLAGPGRTGLSATVQGLLRPERGAVADARAAARAVAGRMGLGRWLDVETGRAPQEAIALADCCRAVIAEPLAVVWRRPEWLADPAWIAEVLADEQGRLGFAVLELRTTKLPGGEGE